MGKVKKINSISFAKDVKPVIVFKTKDRFSGVCLTFLIVTVYYYCCCYKYYDLIII